MNTILISMAVLGAIGVSFGLIMSFASIKLKVSEDAKLTAIKAIMPNANCGACGFPGCAAFAEATLEGRAKPDGCLVGRRRGLPQQIEEILAQ